MISRGCPKGVVKRKPSDIRALILAELARGDRIISQLCREFSLSKQVAYRNTKVLVSENKIHVCGRYKNRNGGVHPEIFRIGPQPKPVVRRPVVGTPVKVARDPLTAAFFGSAGQVNQ